MIHILSPEVANRIAAGEVVERPASVVRELIDNAIDAEASRIDVEVEEGGLKSIRVSDNGFGMSRDDAVLSIKRHATSKIQHSEDLAQIMTRGFRGEALAAISSVSRFEIKTRQQQEELGTHLILDGGKEPKPKDTGTPVGTLVTVKDLFYNIPARRKFLKKPATEQGHVLSTLTWNALAHETIHFTFSHNGRRTLDLPPVSNRPERIKQIFGKDMLENLFPVHFDSPVVSISGLISRPTYSRNNAQQIYFFVNDRFIKDRLLHRAMMNGYRNLLHAGRYPVAFLFLEIDPTEIDVNVHPTKQEIKFSREDAVFSAMYGAIRQAWDTREEAKQETQQIVNSLQKKQQDSHPYPTYKTDAFIETPKPTSWEPQKESTPPPKEKQPEYTPSLNEYPAKEETPSPQQECTPKPIQEEAKGSNTNNEQAQPVVNQAPAQPEENSSYESIAHLNRRPLEPTPLEEKSSASNDSQNPLEHLTGTEKESENLLIPTSLEETGKLTVKGQLMNSYILAEAQDGLYIIDQHAAHERLLFEKFLQESEKTKALASQSMLFPLTIDFSPDEINVVEEQIPVLAKLGFEIEPFGPKTYAVHAIPSSLPMEQTEEFLRDYIAEHQNQEESSLKAKQEQALHTLSCKAAVKFGDPLSPEDMETLVRDLEKIPRRNVCPHGRPAILYISDHSLRRAFKRMGF